MSELYQRPIDPDRLAKAVAVLLEQGKDKPLDLLLADQLSQTLEDGIRIGLSMRCNDVVMDVPKIEESHDVLQAIHHSDACLLQAQSICYNVMPGVIELPELIADFAHKSYAAGFDKGYEEGYQDRIEYEDDKEDEE